MRRTNGFTLIEIMVAVGILSVVVAGVMESFVVQNRAYTVVDQTTETQQNLRAIAHLLERDIRMTGFMVPEGAVACGIDATSTPGLLPGSDVLYVTDADAIDPKDAAGELDQPQANLGSTINVGYTGGATLMSIVVDDLGVEGKPAYDTDGDGLNDSDFRIGGGAIVVDPSDPTRGTGCGVVVDVNPGGNSLRVEFETGIGVGGTLLLIPAHRYTVSDAGALRRDGTEIVSDVDDLQVAYFVDANDNGDADANEYLADGGAGADYDSAGTDHSELREIRVNLVLRSRTADGEYSEGTEQATENRAPTGVADGFRRRVLTSTVKPRNIGFRGTTAG